MKVVICNTKGGVGKSTTAVHLAVWLHSRGLRTALLDLDKQRSSLVWIAEAEPGITTRTADSPEECLSEAQNLSQSHDVVVADGPAGLDDLSRTLLLIADLALVPLTPSILDLRSVHDAVAILKFAQQINGGRPDGKVILNRMRTRDTISRDLRSAVETLGLTVARYALRDLQAYRDAPQQGTVVHRMGRRSAAAAADMDLLFEDLLGDRVRKLQQRRDCNTEVGNG